MLVWSGKDHLPRPCDRQNWNIPYRLATISQPLCILVSKQAVWTWGQSQDTAFQAVKDDLTKSPVLVLFQQRYQLTPLPTAWDLFFCKSTWTDGDQFHLLLAPCQK